MNFPHPESSISAEGAQRSGADLANEASAARREAQIQHAMTRRTQPQMVTRIDPPSEAELARERNRRLQRNGNDVSAFQRQLQAIADEREGVTDRLAYLRGLADAALRDGNTGKVREFRAKIEDATVQADRLDLLESDARDGLARAEREATARLVALEASVPEAEAKLRAWAKVQTEYTKLAARIAEIVGMEAEAEAAYRTLLQAAQILESCEMPPPFPTRPGGKALRTTVVLPGHCHPPTRPPSPNDAYAR